jgi:hypothetical protein
MSQEIPPAGDSLPQGPAATAQGQAENDGNGKKGRDAGGEPRDPAKLVREALSGKGKESSATGRLPLGKIDLVDLERVADLCVRSSDFQSKWGPEGSRPDYNVWIVHGPEHSGKLTTAIRLALDLLGCDPEDEKVYAYRRARTDSLPLIDFARDPELKEKKGAYVLEDTFDRNVDIQELTSPWLEALNRVLEDNKSYLILTTEWNLQELESLNVGKISAFPLDLHEVFENHLRRFARHVEGVDVQDSVVEAARRGWKQVEPYLKKPVQIERFCYKLGELRSAEENLVPLAQEAAYIGQASVRKTFAKLGKNQQLYALLAVLFDGIERAALDDFYALAVRHLRSEGVSTLRDEREIGLDDILERIRARESETRQVEIEDAELREEALRQARNHRRLLHSLAQPLLTLCVEHSAPEHWELRRAIGAALGRLGALEKRGLEPVSEVLDALADHPEGGVASVAGFVLAQICRDAPQLRGDVLARLDAWVRSGDPDRMWAAGAAVWRIFDEMVPAREVGEEKRAGDWHGRTLGVLATLIRRADEVAHEDASWEERELWTRENLRCAFFALERIAGTSALAAAGKLAEWLRGEPGDRVQEIAQFACASVLEQAAIERRGPVPEHLAWLQLIEPLLSLSPDLAGAGDALMAALSNWSRWSSAETGPDPLFDKLLAAANRLSGSAAKSLRSGLVRHWLTSEEKEVRRRGRALLLRSHAMEGFPLRNLRRMRGVVALDASPAALTEPGDQRFALQLLEVAGCYVDTVPGHLGGRRIRTGKEALLGARDLRSTFPRPRLLLPLVEGTPEGPPEISVVLAWGPLLDLADGEDQAWWPPLVVSVGEWDDRFEGSGTPQGDSASKIRRVPLTPDLDGVVAEIIRRLNAAYREPDSEPPPAVPDWQELDKPDRSDGAPGAPDRAARIIAAVLEQSESELSSALTTVRTWLDPSPAGDLLIRLGHAALRALLRFHAEPGHRPSDADKETILRLGFRLSPSDQGAAETILETVLAWMEEPAWAGRITGGGDLSFSWMRWFESLIPHQARALDGWLAAAEDRFSLEVKSDAVARRMLKWLRFRLSLGAGAALPVLEGEGRGYGVLLLDAAAEPSLGDRFARLTTDLQGHPKLRETPLLIFRMGHKAPLAVPGEKLDLAAMMPAAGSRLPRLLGPILEALPPERILFALVLAAGTALDAGDWADGPWASRIRLYSPLSRSPAAEPFVRIAPGTEGADAVVNGLMPLIEQGA